MLQLTRKSPGFAFANIMGVRKREVEAFAFPAPVGVEAGVVVPVAKKRMPVVSRGARLQYISADWPQPIAHTNCAQKSEPIFLWIARERRPITRRHQK